MSSAPDQHGDETYHMRHPILVVQPLHPHPPSQFSEQEKHDQNELRKTKKTFNLALQSEIDAIRADCDSRVEALAKKYPQKEGFIRASVYNVSAFKPERKVNTWNAEVSYQAKRLRESEH